MKTLSKFLLAVALAVGCVSAHADVLIGSNVTTGWTSTSSVNTLTGERWVGEQYVASTSGNVTSLCYYTFNDHDPNIKLALADSGGNVLAVTGAIVVSAAGAGAFICGSVSSTAVTASSTYYIMSTSDGTNTGRIACLSDTTTGDYIAADGNYASPPATMALSADGGNPSQLFYADGTPSGGGGSTLPVKMNLYKQLRSSN